MDDADAAVSLASAVADRAGAFIKLSIRLHLQRYLSSSLLFSTAGPLGIGSARGITRPSANCFVDVSSIVFPRFLRHCVTHCDRVVTRFKARYRARRTRASPPLIYRNAHFNIFRFSRGIIQFPWAAGGGGVTSFSWRVDRHATLLPRRGAAY